MDNLGDLDFYTLHNILSYNCPVNVIITERGKGKSFQVKKYIVDKYKKKKEKFLYLRRYENELKNVFEKSDLKDEKNEFDFFNNIKHLFPNVNLKSKNRKFYYNDVCFGLAKRITEYQDLKSSDFTDITTIIIDEYFIEPGRRSYLPSEGMILMNLFDTVARNRDRNKIRIFILGNSVPDLELSPLFLFFNLSLPFNKTIKTFKNNLIALEYSKNSNFSKQRSNTFIGELAKGTPYDDYAVQNKIINKNNDFIAKKSKYAKFRFSFIFKGQSYGVWISSKEGRIYISKDISDLRYQYALTLEDQSINTMLVKGCRNFAHWRFLIDNFKLANIYYESNKLKQNAMEAFKLFI